LAETLLEREGSSGDILFINVLLCVGCWQTRPQPWSTQVLSAVETRTDLCPQKGLMSPLP
jgi:hypothetical protein